MKQSNKIVLLMWVCVIVVALITLSACSTMDAAVDRTQSVKQQAVVTMARTNDILIEDAILVLCKGPKGAIDRKFGQSQALADAYNKLCRLVTGGQVDIGPNSQPVRP